MAEVTELKPTERTMEVLQKEFAEHCAQLGQLLFHFEMNKQTAVQKISDLNKEAAALSAKKAEETKTEVNNVAS